MSGHHEDDLGTWSSLRRLTGWPVRWPSLGNPFELDEVQGAGLEFGQTYEGLLPAIDLCLTRLLSRCGVKRCRSRHSANQGTTSCRLDGDILAAVITRAVLNGQITPGILYS